MSTCVITANVSSSSRHYRLVFLFICPTHSQQPQRQQSHPQRHHARRLQQLAKTRRIYAMCPPGFTKIGNECYFLSPTKASWLDSHFECKDKNGKLAEPLKSSDRQLRKYLLERGRTRGEIWIGKPSPSIKYRMSDNLSTFRTNNSRWHVQLAEDEVAVGLQRKGHEVSVVQSNEAWVISDQLSIS